MATIRFGAGLRICGRRPPPTAFCRTASSSGQDPEKLKQLAIIESAHIEAYGDFPVRPVVGEFGQSSVIISVCPCEAMPAV